MTIAQALKHKVKLVTKIKRLSTQLRIGNIAESTSGPLAYETPKILKELQDAQLELIKLKKDIYKANLPIIGKLYEMSELKSLIASFKAIPTLATTTIKTDSYVAGQQVTRTSTCFITTLEKDKIIADWEEKIEALQEEIDQFNHSTKI